MKRVVLIVLGVILLLVGTPMLVGGTVLNSWANGDDPSIGGRLGTLESSGYAVVSDKVAVDSNWPLADRWDITVGVQSADSGPRVFLGYGPAEAVDAYLAGAPYTLVGDLGTGDLDTNVDIPGTAEPEPPVEQTFWIQQTSGEGRQSLVLETVPSGVRFVAMNADATAEVNLSVYGSFTVPFLGPLGIGTAVFGGVLLVVGLVLLVLGIRARPAAQAASYAPVGQDYPQPYPGDPSRSAPYPGTEQATTEPPPDGSAPPSQP